jgi:hypothetical protein
MSVALPGTEAAWALRTYLILIGCAADRQTVTYDALAARTKRAGLRLLAAPLEILARWCDHHGLPSLACIVVEQASQLPTPGIVVASKDDVPGEQQRVWAFDWYAVRPPTLEELEGQEKIG